MKLLIFTNVLIAALLVGCGPSAPAPLSEADLATIEATSATFMNALEEGNRDVAVSVYTEDAVLLPPNHEMVTGRAAIRKYLNTLPSITRFELKNVEIKGSGDMAVVRGTYHMTFQLPDMPPMEDHGKFVDTRKRQADGSWPLQWDIWNSSVALPATGN